MDTRVFFPVDARPGWYEALARINRAVVRGGTLDDLCAEMCAACVDHGHAQLATAWCLDGRRLVMKASAGPLQALVDGDVPAADLDLSVCASSVAAEALRTGHTTVCNDCGDDDAPAALGHDGAVPARSVAVVPLRRGDVVAGALVLHADMPGHFDHDRVALLEAVGATVSYALAQHDREHARREAERALRDREQQFSGIVETAMDAIITVDASHRIRLFNQAASRMFRVDAADAIGTPLDRFVPPEARAAHARHVDEFARTGSTSRRMGALHVLSGVRADGESFPIEASISKFGDGADALMTVVIRDLSATLDAERARAAQVAAEAASQAKSAFISRMSHELRTPLNAVLGFAQLLEHDADGTLDERQRDYLAKCQQAGHHLLEMINDLLDLSGIEAGQIQVRPAALRLGDVVDAALTVAEPVAHARQVCVVRPAAAQADLGVFADPQRLRQIVINLVSNGVKYNRPGGRVELHARRVGAWVQLDVVDDGLGMSAEQCAHLFEPFNRLGRESSGVEGSGLGLALTRQLVTAMGGRIEVTSAVGQGTRMRISLLAAAVPTLPPRRAGATSSEPAGVVLCVEDNPVNMTLVEQFLARWPRVRLVKARNGAEGLARARDARPDLVLLDLHLPDTTGLDVLRTLRADPLTRELPVIMLSAEDRGSDLARSVQDDADDYCSKPLDFTQLEHRLRLRLASV